MSDNTLSTLRAAYSLEVYEKFKQEALLVQGYYSEDRILQLGLTLELVQNNIDPNDAAERL